MGHREDMAEDTSKQTTRRKGTKREPLSSGAAQTTGATKPSFMSKAFKPKPKVEATASDAKPSAKKILPKSQITLQKLQLKLVLSALNTAERYRLRQYARPLSFA